MIHWQFKFTIITFLVNGSFPFFLRYNDINKNDRKGEIFLMVTIIAIT